MARLPTLDDLGQRPTPQAYTGKPIVVPNAGAVADAAAGIGDKIAAIGQQKLEEQDKLQLATARSNFLAKKVELDTEAENDPDWQTQEKRYSDAIIRARDDAGKGIQSSHVRAAFDIDTKPDVARGMASVRTNVFAKQKDAKRAGLTTTLKDNNDAALAAPDPQDSMRLIESSAQALQAAQADGTITAQEAAAKRIEVTEGYAKGRLSLFSDEKQVEMLSVAMTGEKTNSFLDYLPLDKRKELLDSAKIRVRTEQRALRAEQRLQMQDEVDGAEETLRLANDGVPVPLDVIDAKIAIAKKAGKDVLAYGLGVARVKTALSAEHRADTPAEMQDDINALNVRITAAGDKAKPEDVIGRDHLVSLRDRASAALKDDPISWASSAWGVKVPPLNWDDPAVLGERLKLARTVAKRTGAALSPLTNEEADELKVDLDKGPAGQLAVLRQISKFGPQGAVAVARQIAPNNDGFRVAAGLATLPNVALAREASRDAIIGADAIKASPALFDEQQAQREFSKYAAPAMRLLPPEMRLGVYQAAKSIYGARVSRSGADKWDKDFWPGAVSSALGGFISGGQKHGGLGTWRGEPIILPQDWTQPDLEKALGRATDADLAKAGSGWPVWANGAIVPANRLKQLNLVADGDGTYRVSDGNGFLSNQAGGPYRLNVRKLPR